MKNRDIFAVLILCFLCLGGIFRIYWNQASLPPVLIATESAPAASAPRADLININTATVQQLQELPGIGPVLAQRIVDYRSEHGDFTQIAQLLQVQGIGSATFRKIKDYIQVGGTP